MIANRWTALQIDLLRRFYVASGSGPVDLARAAKLIGKDKSNVCRKARALGLTNQSRAHSAQPKLPVRPTTPEELHAKQSASAKRRTLRDGHHRGMLGKRHTPEVKAALAESTRRMWADPNSFVNSEAHRQALSDRTTAMVAAGSMRGGGFSRGTVGRRADLDGLFVRSRWEANYARYLNLLIDQRKILLWLYEPMTFVFDQITRGTRAYTPDFRVTFPDGRIEWHEVKGWMDTKSRTRLDRMARYFPNERVIVLDEAWFKSASKTIAPLIPNWEGAGSKDQVMAPLVKARAEPREMCCPECLVEFIATSATSRYCTPRCRRVGKKKRLSGPVEVDVREDRLAVDEAARCREFDEVLGS